MFIFHHNKTKWNGSSACRLIDFFKLGVTEEFAYIFTIKNVPYILLKKTELPEVNTEELFIRFYL